MLDTYTWFHGVMLGLAILFEVAANIFLKSSEGFSRRWHGLAAIVLVLLAFTCLYFAIEGIALSIAYATWGGVGIIATAVLGWLLFGQRILLAGWAGIVLLTGGLLLLKMA